MYAAPQPVYYGNGGWGHRYDRGDYYRGDHRYERGWDRNDRHWGYEDRGGWRD
ncbi:MAG: FIG00457263: hypothetical protein [uncultured Paraburkholderia sp.]|nr:MAG: FIG00457263: hypothetical protein [uncultured Paraburkholderia sp.]